MINRQEYQRLFINTKNIAIKALNVGIISTKCQSMEKHKDWQWHQSFNNARGTSCPPQCLPASLTTSSTASFHFHWTAGARFHLDLPTTVALHTATTTDTASTSAATLIFNSLTTTSRDATASASFDGTLSTYWLNCHHREQHRGQSHSEGEVTAIHPGDFKGPLNMLTPDLRWIWIELLSARYVLLGPTCINQWDPERKKEK